MSDPKIPTEFLEEAEARRETIASQIEHIDEHDAKLRETIEGNGRWRARLRELDRQYAEAIAHFGRGVGVESGR